MIQMYPYSIARSIREDTTIQIREDGRLTVWITWGKTIRERGPKVEARSGMRR
jgi:hypothetical protein